jgi:hypothetical protein
MKPRHAAALALMGFTLVGCAQQRDPAPDYVSIAGCRDGDMTACCKTGDLSACRLTLREQDKSYAEWATKRRVLITVGKLFPEIGTPRLSTYRQDHLLTGLAVGGLPAGRNAGPASPTAAALVNELVEAQASSSNWAVCGSAGPATT